MKVSYIVPCYNCEKTVRESLDSIIDQNLEVGDEIVCVDDGSTDQTKAILEEYAQKHSFIRFVIHDKNNGGGATRNTAVKHSKNEWIYCLDSDNILAPQSVSRLKNIAHQKSVGGVFFQKAILFEESPNKQIGERSYCESKIPLEGYLSRWDIPGASGNYLFEKRLWEKAGGYPEFAGALDTTGFGLRVAALGVRLACDHEGFYYHRSGHESYWQRFRKGNVSDVMFQLLEPYFSKLEAGEI